MIYKEGRFYDENGSVVVKIRFRTDDKIGNIKAKSNAQITIEKMRSEWYHVEKRVTRSQTLRNEEIECL